MKRLIPITLLLLAACGSNKDEKNEREGRGQAEQTENYVDTMTLRLADFNREVVCNGHLRAAVKSALAPRHTDIVTSISVREGQHVDKGELLAVTDETNYLREVERAEREVERTRVDLADKLLQLGHDVDVDLNPRGDIPADILRRAEVTSGHYAARFALQTARRNLDDCRVTAPRSGRIADLEARLHQSASKICNIVDDTSFDVEFSVLEAELPTVGTGHRVRVTPFADDSLTVTGSIVSVNPTVSDKGTVKVTARVPGHSGLMDGMNVRVVVERSVPRMFVVPKDAVVERDGYNVVFLYDNGRARWTYVDIAASNITSHAITGCARKETTLHEGDIVITSGNLNLADDTKVKCK
ncbi:MAG: efflux RND transporter periplasmic adaptor subunit [Paraprevotella sp.]|nr:efflux RND transporter periplasmic adaptor subunit [Paraprevotella sp.]